MKDKILKNYINGRWVESKTEKTRDVINPAIGDLIAKTPMCTKEDALQAIEAAKAAFWRWRTTPAQTRIRYLYDFRDALEENFDELAEVCTLEHGKTLDESRGEYRRTIENIEAAASIPTLQMGYNFEDVAAGIDEMVIKQPLGVFFCVAPFNFPAMVPTWFWPFAIATGNTYVLKPSDQCPMTMVKQFELIDELDLPKGVLNLVHGGAEVVNTLIESPDTVGLSFVGSTKIGNLLYSKCGEYGKRVQVQGGAKNFITVMPDANIERTVPNLITSFYGNAGQRCLAGGVLLAVGEIYEPLKEALVEAAKKITVGNGLDENVQMGPLATKAGKERVISYIEKGIEEGAKLILDGRKVKVKDDLSKGFFVGPTIFDKVTPEMTIAHDEIFGPVIPIIQIKDLDEAIDIIHANPYGNASSVFTSSGKTAREYQYRVNAGNIGINIGVVAPIATFPFSGMKDSFKGDLHGQGKNAVDFFTEEKVVITRWF
ncbi:MAG: CoA-acylating methylmalonate-semialdehyde dehydrogenase [Candidatus Heimdallarchaeota archaeon]|nr:MAG: CoA-acylating methylmalonate-semialdehyde dehydrogenase [Candidatus Heimdallarchaeota archaeon]